MNIEVKANNLYKNCKDLSSFDKDNSIKISSSKEAYKIQDKFIQIKEKDMSDKIGGWKVALTNPEMQKLVKVDRPVEGAIMKSLIYKSGDTISFDQYVHLGAEAEIALKVEKNIPKDSKVFQDKIEILPYFKEVFSALEVVDDRNYADKCTFEYLVAQNSMNHGCVLSEPVVMDLMSLDQLTGKLFLSNKVFGEGTGKNVLGHPLNSVLYLINNLMSRGRTLYAGDIILTGSIATTCWPLNGDVVEAKIEGLKPAKFYVN